MLLLFAGLALLLLTLFLPVRVMVYWRSRQKALLLRVNLKLPLLPAFRVAQTRVTAASVRESLTKKRKVHWRIGPLLKKLRDRIERLTLTLRLGTGDAALTACLVGGICGALAFLAAGKPERTVTVEPIFQEKTFFARGNCIIRTSVVHTIISILASAKRQKK